MTRTLVLTLLAVATTTPALAQRHGGGGHGGGFHGGGSSRGGGSAHGGSFHGGGSFQGGNRSAGFHRSGEFHRGGFPDGRHHGGQGGYRSGAGFSGGSWHGHLPTHRIYHPGRTVHVANRYSARGYNDAHFAVRPYRATEWRRDHPSWHDHYYYRGGHYYYDSYYRYPAVVDNEWSSIAALSGGVALLGAFTNDPYLTFGGAAGALYSLTRYDSDLHSGDRHLRLRAAYFGRPYFWRNGHRYDRTIVTTGGHRYYRFRRH